MFWTVQVKSHLRHWGEPDRHLHTGDTGELHLDGGRAVCQDREPLQETGLIWQQGKCNRLIPEAVVRLERVGRIAESGEDPVLGCGAAMPEPEGVELGRLSWGNCKHSTAPATPASMVRASSGAGHRKGRTAVETSAPLMRFSSFEM